MAEDAAQRIAERVCVAARRMGAGVGSERRILSAPVLTVALLAALLVPGLAYADCNQTTVHPVAPPPVSTSFSNQTFDAANPYVTQSIGQAGCDGGPGGAGQSGGNGFPG